MKGLGRVGDQSFAPIDVHGCNVCPHSVKGPAISWSPDVIVNYKPALRVGDRGIHSLCCGTNTWVAQKGSNSVIINGKPAHRLGDSVKHCGGMGNLVEGSPDVLSG